MRKLDFVYFDAGGGHRAAANALRQVMELEERRCEIRMVNLQELLDTLDVFRKVTGLRLAKVLPWEEAAFFFLTSLLVAQSYLLLLPENAR